MRGLGSGGGGRAGEGGVREEWGERATRDVFGILEGLVALDSCGFVSSLDGLERKSCE